MTGSDLNARSWRKNAPSRADVFDCRQYKQQQQQHADLVRFCTQATEG